MSTPPCNVVFDESGTFLLYATILGIKVLNTRTNAVRLVLGQVESTERFLSIALYQGIPKVSSQLRRLAPGTTVGGTSGQGDTPDPTLVCCAYKRQRFFLFSRREPNEDGAGGCGADGRRPRLISHPPQFPLQTQRAGTCSTRSPRPRRPLRL